MGCGFSHLGSGERPWTRAGDVGGADLPTAQRQASYWGPECSRWNHICLTPWIFLSASFPISCSPPLAPSGGPASIRWVSPADPHRWGGRAPTPFPCWLVQPPSCAPRPPKEGRLGKVALTFSNASPFPSFTTKGQDTHVISKYMHPDPR